MPLAKILSAAHAKSSQWPLTETKFDEAQSAIIAVKPKPITPTRSSGLSH